MSTQPIPTPLSISGALRTSLPKREFILPGLRRKTAGALIGPGGTGKTMLALQIAVAQALGLPAAGDLFPAPPAPRKVAFVSAEDPAEEFVIRLHALAADMLGYNDQLDLLGQERLRPTLDLLDSNLLIFPCSGMDMRIVSNLRSTERLHEIVAATRGCDLAIVETVSRLHDGDENTTASMTALTAGLETWAVQNNTAILALHHSSRSADLNERGDSQHASRGSSAFVDNLRYIANLFRLTEKEAERMGVTEYRKQYVRFEVTKANYIPPQLPRILRRRACGLLRTEDVDTPRRASRSSKRVLA